jgi:hypothetical protein
MPRFHFTIQSTDKDPVCPENGRFDVTGHIWGTSVDEVSRKLASCCVADGNHTIEIEGERKGRKPQKYVFSCFNPAPVRALYDLKKKPRTKSI